MRALAPVIALAVPLLAACPARATAPALPPGSPLRTLELTRLIGGWTWEHRAAEAGTTRVEAESWRFRPTGTPTQLAGRYVRTVTVQSDDRVPFECNQRTRYRQRAVFDVVVDVTRTGYEVRETASRAEPGPCDHGFRKLGAYTATLGDTASHGHATVQLAWAGGTQTLTRTDSATAALPADPWPTEPGLAGAWRWESSSYDREGNVQDETEWWYVTPRTATRLDATYRRRVTVRSPDGTRITCANAASWTFDDAYVLDGQREDAHWHFHELAAQPGDHPCLRVSPRRALDEATVEQLGDALVVEWRGKRRQVLTRD